MCRTLNSAAEWEGSMFQILVEVVAAVGVAVKVVEVIWKISFSKWFTFDRSLFIHSARTCGAAQLDDSVDHTLVSAPAAPSDDEHPQVLAYGCFSDLHRASQHTEARPSHCSVAMTTSLPVVGRMPYAWEARG
jgi:hypothetical protein